MGTADVSGYNIWWSDYMDSGGFLVPMVYAYAHDVAAANSWNYENMFLHFNQDYTVTDGVIGPTTWSNMDCFDVWEEIYGGSLNQNWGTCAISINGALIYNGTSYRDVTEALYAATCSPVCEVANGDRLYLGYAEPFALINITLSVNRVGGTATWQYWNGSSWATLTPSSDSSNGLTTNGAIQFSPPVDWVPTVVNASQSKYWVRLNIANIATAPTLAKVWGDDLAFPCQQLQRRLQFPRLGPDTLPIHARNHEQWDSVLRCPIGHRHRPISLPGTRHRLLEPQLSVHQSC